MPFNLGSKLCDVAKTEMRDLGNDAVRSPMVSVIVPNYNHAKYLPERLESVFSQTYADYEVILLDDGSTDGSAALLEACRANPHVSHVELNPKNSGGYPFAQWEKGIRLAKGKYVWIAESDDRAEPTFLEKAVAAIEAHPAARICIVGSHVIDSEGKRMDFPQFDVWETPGGVYEYVSDYFLSKRMLYCNSVYNASMALFKREGCLDIDQAFRTMRYCGDCLFWIEQIKKGSVVEVREKLNYFRKHDTNTTSQGTQNGNSFPEIAYVKNVLFTGHYASRIDILMEKMVFYRAVRHLPVEKQRKQELFKVLAEVGNTKYRHYLAGRILRKLFPFILNNV